MFAEKRHGVLVHLAVAFRVRTFAQRLLPAQIHFGGGAIRIGLPLAEVELRFAFRAEFDHRREGPTEFAAEALQWPDGLVGEQVLDLRHVELPARHDLPEGEIALLALEFFVILADFPAALRARHPQGAEIPGHRVALMALRLGHNRPGHIRDFAHEIRPLQLPAGHLQQLEFPVAGQFG